MHKERIVTAPNARGMWSVYGRRDYDAPAFAGGGYWYLGRWRGGHRPLKPRRYYPAGKEPDGAGRGVIEGRRTFLICWKIYQMTASSNFGNVFSVLVAKRLCRSCQCCRALADSKPAVRCVSQVAIPFDMCR